MLSAPPSMPTAALGGESEGGGTGQWASPAPAGRCVGRGVWGRGRRLGWVGVDIRVRIGVGLYMKGESDVGD